MNSDEGRRRLGREVRAERVKRFRTVDRARIAAGISRGAWDNVERGESVKDFTLAAIELALEWPPGRAQDIIDGAPIDSIEATVEASNLPPETKARVLGLLAKERIRDEGRGVG